MLRPSSLVAGVLYWWQADWWAYVVYPDGPKPKFTMPWWWQAMGNKVICHVCNDTVSDFAQRATTPDPLDAPEAPKSDEVNPRLRPVSLPPGGQVSGGTAMARRKNQVARDIRRALRERVAAAVAEAFPGCVPDFCGGVERSRMAARGPTLGFRVRDADGTYHSNVIWLNPGYTGAVTAGWVRRAVARSNGA